VGYRIIFRHNSNTPPAQHLQPLVTARERSAASYRASCSRSAAVDSPANPFCHFQFLRAARVTARSQRSRKHPGLQSAGQFDAMLAREVVQRLSELQFGQPIRARSIRDRALCGADASYFAIDAGFLSILTAV
jgi:hypothetical protein